MAYEETLFSNAPSMIGTDIDDSTAFRSSSRIIDDFLPADTAAAMRGDIETHFSNPQNQRPDTHQVWNYWFIPQHYTYFRTKPEKVIKNELVNIFYGELKSWAIQALGMQYVAWPNLSLYVNGCQQSLHNDSANGRFGFVYSLTKNNRRSSGGNTLLMHEGDPFRSALNTPATTKKFYDIVEPSFNRLIIFDDRIPHAVERVEGTMDPLEGRFVMHGHICEGGPIIKGPLPQELIIKMSEMAVQELLRDAEASDQKYHGPLSVRFTIQESGGLGECRVLLDRVIGNNPKDMVWRWLVKKFLTRICLLRFPPNREKTEVTLPILIGGMLPWLN